MPIPKTPDLLPSVLGEAADEYPIPTTPPLDPAQAGALNYATGWPQITGIPLEAGGIAPQREYFNAVYKLFSSHLFFLQSGGVYPWSAALNYPTGAHALGSDGVEYAAVKASGPDVPDSPALDPVGAPDTTVWRKTTGVEVPIATTQRAGIVIPDGMTISITPDGVISAKRSGAVGDFVFQFGTTRAGALLCNGAAVSRSTYAHLYSIIGTLYGAGDGATTFNLPDARGRVLQGAQRAGERYVEAGLPNVTGSLSNLLTDKGFAAGAFRYSTLTPNIHGLGTGRQSGRLDMDLAAGNQVYGRSNTVQPAAVTLNIFIVY